MNHSTRHREPLLGHQLDGAVFEVDEEAAVDDVEEFVFVIVFVPVKFALHDAEADDAVIHLAESLVVPLVLTGFDERFEIDELEGAEFCVQIDGIRGLTGHASLPWLQRCAYFISGPREGVAGSTAEKVRRETKRPARRLFQGASRAMERKKPRRKNRRRGYWDFNDGPNVGTGGGLSRRGRRSWARRWSCRPKS